MDGAKQLAGAHTVNEHMRVNDFVGMIRCVERMLWTVRSSRYDRYFTALILNADEAEL